MEVWQIAVTVFFGIATLLSTAYSTWLKRELNILRSRMSEIDTENKKSMRELDRKIFDMNANLPEKYVTKEELYRLIDKMFDKLEKISDKLDDKQDKD